MRTDAQRKYDRDWYAAHGDRIRPCKNERSRALRDRNAEFVFNYLIWNPCAECGEDDPVVLQFDHIDPGTKKFDIADMVGNKGSSLKALMAEIKKCRVLCANCHQRHTAKTVGYRVYKLAQKYLVE